MPDADARAAAVWAAFRSQADACRALGSPFVARLCDLAADRLTETHSVGRRVLGWTGDPASSADSVPLRFAGALHSLVLGGVAEDLAAVFPPHTPDPTALWAAVERACHDHAELVLARLESPPQTNEVRRSSALLPGFLTIAKRFGKPLCLSEVGASAGLNLHWDRFAYRLGDVSWGDPQSPVTLTPDWKGRAPPATSLVVEDRAGCDLRPLDPASPDDAQRLLSYLWADQADRIARTRAAIALVASSEHKVEAVDAVSWLERRLALARPGSVHVVYHTIAWQYLSATDRERGEALIGKAGRAATEAAPFARLSLENDGTQPGAALTLQMWPSGERHEVGRADFHGRWVDWSGWPGLS
ncbi:DUF2332 domain-containing protein [Rhizobium sp. Leaf341]|uniref:DUF2332 domain-containing protein n=1 Tax=Rhizobium sp. Leaf341 TaxID=1736344 RepID=UPI00071499F6|nr:DUF2332 family protein [Rhizobium sp. Leaf341]KQR75938.1 hypothetical protein ASG03_20040 [Rhizobium sp. Leaf341]